MNEAMNPFAPPGASLQDDATGGVWRDGKVLVVRQDATLPARCVKCGEPAEPGKIRKLYWHHPAIYALVIFWVLIYIIVAMIFRKNVSVNPSLCPAHLKRRRVAIALGWAGGLAGLAAVVTGMGSDNCLVGLLGGLLLLGSVLGSFMVARILYPETIDKEYARLRGCGENFLALFPPFNG